MTDAMIKVCPGCCGNTGGGHLTKHWGGVGKRTPRKDSLRELLLRLAWSSQSPLWRDGQREHRPIVCIVTIKAHFGDKQVFSLLEHSQELRDW